jgi:putative NADPH-quinone reductase
VAKSIVILQGHPDPAAGHFGHTLAAAYAEGARAAGHDVEVIPVAQLDFPLLRTKENFEQGPVPAPIQEAQAKIKQADHLVVIYPLWLGGMPALLKGFLEQLFRPGFVTGGATLDLGQKRQLRGKSARIVVTMGMPALVYRWFFGAHSLKSLERNILGFCGFRPIKESLIGLVESPDRRRREKWLARMRTLGHAAA